MVARCRVCKYSLKFCLLILLPSCVSYEYYKSIEILREIKPQLPVQYCVNAILSPFCFRYNKENDREKRERKVDGEI